MAPSTPSSTSTPLAPSALVTIQSALSDLENLDIESVVAAATGHPSLQHALALVARARDWVRAHDTPEARAALGFLVGTVRRLAGIAG